jgi:hypothetical protein
MRSVYRQFPLKPKIALDSGTRMQGDDRDEQGAGLDLLADGSIPGIAAAQFALVEPHVDRGGAQG